MRVKGYKSKSKKGRVKFTRAHGRKGRKKGRKHGKKGLF